MLIELQFDFLQLVLKNAVSGILIPFSINTLVNFGQDEKAKSEISQTLYRLIDNYIAQIVLSA